MGEGNMQVQIAIGENHRFELREALLVYYGNQTTFITKHEVTTQQNAAPTLGPAQPLTVAFVELLVRSLGRSCCRSLPREHPRQKRSHDRLVDAGTAPPDVLSALRGKSG